MLKEEGGVEEENVDVVVRTQFEALVSRCYLVKVSSCPSELSAPAVGPSAKDASPGVRVRVCVRVCVLGEDSYYPLFNQLLRERGRGHEEEREKKEEKKGSLP